MNNCFDDNKNVSNIFSCKKLINDDYLNKILMLSGIMQEMIINISLNNSYYDMTGLDKLSGFSIEVNSFGYSYIGSFNSKLLISNMGVFE